MISGSEMSRIIRTHMLAREVKSQRVLAKAVGITPESLSGYFSGKARMPLPVLSRICTYLGLTQEERGAFLM